jgi:hypothetical protein
MKIECPDCGATHECGREQKQVKREDAPGARARLILLAIVWAFVAIAGVYVVQWAYKTYLVF